ncbi:MAG: alpha/beta hydrolase [Cyanobacteria bacterium REEB459]|nr:alpha/beta hydrolase [Cyanobacteria bacterium REEB459]
MAITTVFGVPHYYELTRAGAGLPLVFIHGWLLSHKYWQPILSRLGQDHTCLTYDLRGFGQSRFALDQFIPGLPAAAARLQSSPSAYSLATYARDLGELLHQLQLDSVWLVGHSLGGSIALWTAYCFPELVKGVICLNAGGGIYIEKDFQQFRQVGQQIIRWRSPWLKYLPLLPLLLSRAMVVKPLGYRWGYRRLQDLVEADPQAALGALLESTTEAEVHLLPRLVSSLSQPTYFLAGCQDAIMDPKFVKHLAAYLPTTSSTLGPVIELANCGHMAMLEQPQKVSETILKLVH